MGLLPADMKRASKSMANVLTKLSQIPADKVSIEVSLKYSVCILRRFDAATFGITAFLAFQIARQSYYERLVVVHA
jgi:hypothetical protein